MNNISLERNKAKMCKFTNFPIIKSDLIFLGEMDNNGVVMVIIRIKQLV